MFELSTNGSVLLNLLILFPILASIVAWRLDSSIANIFGIIVSGIELILVFIVLALFDANMNALQFVSDIKLNLEFNISYFIGIDGISLIFILLVGIVCFLVALNVEKNENTNRIVSCILATQGLLIGVFSALNFILFYMFWELSLLPVLYLIGAFGSKEKIKTALTFFIYTFSASLLMLVAMLYIGFSANDFNFNILELDDKTRDVLFFGFMAAVAVKVPLFPLHSWLRQTYSNAPFLTSALLSALLSKMGMYLLIRFVYPLFPDSIIAYADMFSILAIFMIIYFGLVAFYKDDIKEVIAYSSVSHMGVALLGIFSMNYLGINGAIFLLFSHGIVSAMLFIIAGKLELRAGSRKIESFGGIARVAPIFSFFFGLAVMANVGLPLTIGFVGEFTTLLGVFYTNPIYGLLGGVTIIISAAYMLNVYKKIFFGKLNENLKNFKDLNLKESLVLSIFALLVIGLGVYPKPILDISKSSVNFSFNVEERSFENTESMQESKESTNEELDSITNDCNDENTECQIQDGENNG